MGEAKRKRRLMEAEWLPLFSVDTPVRVAISRPSARLKSVPDYEAKVAHVYASAEEPPICFNLACNNELRTVQDVHMFIRTDNNQNNLICLCVCAECEKYSDNELIGFVRILNERSGLGLDRQVPGTAIRVEPELPIGGWTGTIAGIPVTVECKKDEEICDAALVFSDLLERGKLKRFLSLRQGIGNCHAIVRVFREELEDSKIPSQHRFAFRRGCSVLAQSAEDPLGYHSWIEFDDWVIEVAHGALQPIIILRKETYYSLMQLTNIHDIRERMK